MTEHFPDGCGYPLAGCWTIWSQCSPIDFGWGLLPTVAQLISSSASGSYASETLSDALRLAYVMGRVGEVLSRYGELRETPRVVAIPGQNVIRVAGLLFKFDNNGSTFLALHERFADLAPLCDPDADRVGEVRIQPSELDNLSPGFLDSAIKQVTIRPFVAPPC